MKKSISFVLLLILQFSSLSACSISNMNNPEKDLTENVELNNSKMSPSIEGKSFPGKIRAKGILGLFAVRGTLSFKDGMLVWTVGRQSESAPYVLRSIKQGLMFRATLPSDNNTKVIWTGIFDGNTIHSVIAKWNRENEDDFVHNIFLPDLVVLAFKVTHQ